MFALQPSQKLSSTENDQNANDHIPNILPCRIHHDGPVESLEHYWTPKSDEKDNLPTAHFRGRRLRGRRVEVPDGYQGVIATPTDRVMPSTLQNGSSADDAETEPEEPIKILEKEASFDHFVVWGHELAPSDDDRFVKGAEEWIQLAEAMHSNPTTETKKTTST